MLIAILAGCASPAAKGPFHLAPEEINAPNYSSKANEITFSGMGVKLSARQVAAQEANGVSPVLDGLMAKKFLIIKLKIENHSPTERAIFDPVFVAITDNVLNYSKPLNYSDLYDIVKEADISGNSLAPLRGRFYDISLTLMPGESSSKYLIFRPISQEADKVVIQLTNIYIGSKTFNVVFPFNLKEGGI